MQNESFALETVDVSSGADLRTSGGGPVISVGSVRVIDGRGSVPP